MNERERIDAVIKALNLSAREFALQIHVQPGTISNMMVGRNNPSLDVMKKILLRYNTLNPEWLILGNGAMWRTEPGKEAGLFDVLPPDPENERRLPLSNSTKEEEQTSAAPQKRIKSIVVYYSDNTFQEFVAQQQ